MCFHDALLEEYFNSIFKRWRYFAPVLTLQLTIWCMLQRNTTHSNHLEYAVKMIISVCKPSAVMMRGTSACPRRNPASIYKPGELSRQQSQQEIYLLHVAHRIVEFAVAMQLHSILRIGEHI